MIYPTFGLTVETLHELKIQSTGSFQTFCHFLNRYFDRIILKSLFEPTKPLELNESDGLWTVNVRSSFGQISLPQDRL